MNPADGPSSGQPWAERNESGDSLGRYLNEAEEYLMERFDRGYDLYQRFLRDPALFAMKQGAQFPCTCVTVQFLIVIIIIVVGMVTQPMEVVMDFESFLKTDVTSSIVREAFW